MDDQRTNRESSWRVAPPKWLVVLVAIAVLAVFGLLIAGAYFAYVYIMFQIAKSGIDAL